MAHVRFAASYEHRDEATGARVRYPAGWSGEVAAPIEAGARARGALAFQPSDAPVASDAPTNPGVTPAPNSPDTGENLPGHDPLADAAAKAAALAAVAASGDDATDEDDPDYESMTKDELMAEAQLMGVTVPSGATKAEIVALLNAA